MSRYFWRQISLSSANILALPFSLYLQAYANKNGSQLQKEACDKFSVKKGLSLALKAESLATQFI